MKKLILTALSMCLITISIHAHSMDNMSGNSSQMMGMKMNMTENDVYSHLSGQDRVIYDKFDAQQKAFVVKMINGASQMQMMHQKMMNGQEMMNGQGQMQKDRGMNRDTMQQDRGMMQQERNK